MQSLAASKDTTSHASKPFFGARATPAPSFFAPLVQAKCATCDEDEQLQRQAEPDAVQHVPGEDEIPRLQAKCAACDREPLKLQPKLTIGAPGDRFEQEADHMADTVMRAPDPQATRLQPSFVRPLDIQRESTESCSISEEPKEPDEVEEAHEDIDPDDEKETPVSPKRDPGDVSPPDDMENRLDSSRGGGHTLSGPPRDFMETRFGYDFSGVRIHTGATSEHLNRGVRSLAFTSGNDIYFGAGQYRPDTDSGKHLLAHELTHVVQQSGAGGGVVREKSDPRVIARREDKPYYSGGAWTSGTATHGVIERLLRDHDDQLVTEAAIPGADRFIPKLNLIGVADLYKSSPAHTVTGVKAYKDADTDDRFVNMNNTDSRGTQPAVDSFPARSTKKTAGGRSWIGDFPEKVWIGEIKPFSFGKLRAGINQLNSYSHGYKDFVRQANKVNGGQTRASIEVERLPLKIPAYLDFDNWASQQKTPSKSVSADKKTRLWVASAGSGVYLYAALSADADVAPPQAYFDHLAELRKAVVGPLSEPAKKTTRMKFISPSTKLAISSTSTGGGPARRVQRDTAERGPTYWSDRARDWEKVRFEWGTRFRSYAGTGLKSQRSKVRFEKALGRHGRALKPVEKKEVKEYKSLMFWSGRAGKFLGKVRFLLGSAWDKALAIFEKMKAKMGGIRTKIAGIKEGGMVKVGWANRLIQVVVAVCKAVFSSFVSESFNFFADCFHSAMDKVVEKFQAEIDEKFGEQICRARKLFEESKQELETQWGDVIRQIEAVVEAIQNVKRWMDIATTAVDLIRIGVQIISCMSPPALGCLWGLVAQLGIGAMVGLVVGTQWFNDNIITPNVRSLLREYIAPHYQNLINRVLGDGLKEYHCHVADDAIPAMNFEAKGGLPTGSSALRSHRDAWESENEPEILKDLGQVFDKPGGKKISKEEFLELAKKIQNSKLTKDQLKELIERSRDPASGKLKIDEAMKNAAKDEMPAATPPKARKIDYPKARQQNVTYQKMRGWDPVTFVKQPGIKVDSDEFANAVYDMQESLNVKADGILGDDTLVAFYDRNKKKPDLHYKEATQAIEDKKAAALERAARDKAAQDKITADKAAADAKAKGPQIAATPTLPAYVKVVSAHSVTATSKDDHIPQDAHVNVYVVNVASYVTAAADGDVVKPVPQFIELDVWVNKKHMYRVTNVAVSRFYISKVFGGFCYWTLWLDMTDGITLDTGSGLLTLHASNWCWKTQ